VVHPAVPAQSARELVALARAKPGALNYASAGSGTGSHLTMELFRSVTGADLVHVPYRGGTAGLTEVLAGHVQVCFNGIPSTVPHVRTQRLRPLAVTTARRAAVLPDVPTVAEAGYPAAESTSWTALVVPAGTPREVIARLHEEAVRALALADVRERLRFDGADPVASSPAQFDAYLRQEIVRWREVVQRSGARAD